MKLRAWLHRVQWANFALLASQVMSSATGVFPDLQMNKGVLITQAILAALLPSLGGVSHKLGGTKVGPGK